jgi:hypothetical protein
MDWSWRIAPLRAPRGADEGDLVGIGIERDPGELIGIDDAGMSLTHGEKIR